MNPNQNQNHDLNRDTQLEDRNESEGNVVDIQPEIQPVNN